MLTASVLVVVPKSIQDHWRAEAEKWFDQEMPSWWIFRGASAAIESNCANYDRQSIQRMFRDWQQTGGLLIASCGTSLSSLIEFLPQGSKFRFHFLPVRFFRLLQ